MLFPARLRSGNCAHRGIEIALPRVFCSGETPFLDGRSYGLASFCFIGKRSGEAKRASYNEPQNENSERRQCTSHKREHRKSEEDACNDDDGN